MGEKKGGGKRQVKKNRLIKTKVFRGPGWGPGGPRPRRGLPRRGPAPAGAGPENLAGARPRRGRGQKNVAGAGPRRGRGQPGPRPGLSDI